MFWKVALGIYYLVGIVVVMIIERAYYVALEINYGRFKKNIKRTSSNLVYIFFYYFFKMITLLIATTFWWIYFLWMMVAICAINQNIIYKDSLQQYYLKVCKGDITIFFSEEEKDKIKEYLS